LKLTAKQERFVAIYAGNGTQAAKAAGYEGSDDTLAVTASKLLRNAKVRDAISKRNGGSPTKIANREERQAWWSRVMNDDSVSMADRIAAARDLGKSEGDFVERVEMTDTTPLSERLAKALARMKALPAPIQAIAPITTSPAMPLPPPIPPESHMGEARPS